MKNAKTHFACGNVIKHKLLRTQEELAFEDGRGSWATALRSQPTARPGHVPTNEEKWDFPTAPVFEQKPQAVSTPQDSKLFSPKCLA